MASTILSEISRLDLQELENAASASITEVKFLSSYNWIEAPNATPTIAVPGSPALWSAPGVSQRLKKDSGLIYIAQNAARHPESPLEPPFRALYITHPSFDIRSTDVVTDRNNIRKLLSFVDPSSTTNGLEAFTIFSRKDIEKEFGMLLCEGFFVWRVPYSGNGIFQLRPSMN